MTRLIALSSALFAVAALFAGTVGAEGGGGVTGQVGPGFEIKMRLNGKTLKTLKAGTYKMKIEDKSGIHDFHLTGPGVNKSTSVGGMAETTWTVKVRKGTYRFVCDPHASQMNGSFRVT